MSGNNQAVFMNHRSFSPEPYGIVLWMGGSVVVLEPATWTDITSSYISVQPTASVAGSHEKMMKAPRQDKYIGFGSWSLGAAPAGSVMDISTVPWVSVNDYTAITEDGSGSSSMSVAASPYGYMAGASHSSTADEAICNIATKAEVAGQPSSFTSAGGGFGAVKVYGDYLYTARSAGLVKYLFTSGTLVQSAINTSYSSSYTDLAVASDDSRVYMTNGTSIEIFDGSLNHLSTVSLTGFSNLETMEISPDDKWLLVAGTASPDVNGKTAMLNTATLAVTYPAVPITGLSSGRMTGSSWYPDSDRYIVTGYSGARTHLGSRSAGGVITNLHTYIGSANAHGAAVLSE